MCSEWEEPANIMTEGKEAMRRREKHYKKEACSIE
jgi:hypothetical protein